jgi:hypothetical protein
VVANVPYRQLAGEMEVKLKEILADKTHWRAMLKEVGFDEEGLVQVKEECLDELGALYESFLELDDVVASLTYPVLQYPANIVSAKLDKTPTLEGRLVGIKGQYWMFDDGKVWNVRSHAGYRVTLTCSKDD